MKSLGTLQEKLYESLEKEKISFEDVDIQKSSISEAVVGIFLLIFMIYGIYQGSIFVLDKFPNKSLFITILLFIAMIIVVLIIASILAVFVEKFILLFVKDNSLRLKKEIVNICSNEFSKKGMFTLSQIHKTTNISQLDEFFLQNILNDLVKKGDLQEIILNDNQILYKCLLESAQKNIKVVFHESK